MKTHNVKCWPSSFDRIDSGKKTFEVRKNDRDYSEGDSVRLWEFDPASGLFSGRMMHLSDIHSITQGTHGLPSDICVFTWSYRSPSQTSAAPWLATPPWERR